MRRHRKHCRSRWRETAWPEVKGKREKPPFMGLTHTRKKKLPPLFLAIKTICLLLFTPFFPSLSSFHSFFFWLFFSRHVYVVIMHALALRSCTVTSVDLISAAVRCTSLLVDINIRHSRTSNNNNTVGNKHSTSPQRP